MQSDESICGARTRREGLRALIRRLPRPSLTLLLAISALVGITAAISHWIGYGDVTIYMGLVALYVAMGAFGGTLRADLSVALLYAGALVLFVAAPVLVAVRSHLVGSILLVVAVGACGLIPALGRRYGSVRLGVGLVTVYAFGYAITRDPSTSHVIVGSFIALAVVVLIRLLAAVPDPDGPLRHAVARVLLETSRGAVESAAAIWLRGPARAWAAEVLVGAVQYRAATWVLVQRRRELEGDRVHSVDLLIEGTAAYANDLAAIVRARRPAQSKSTAVLRDLDRLAHLRMDLHSDDKKVADVALDGLRRAAGCASARSRKVIREAGSIRRAAARGSLRAALSLDSDYFRGALRSMIIVAVALLIVAVADQPAFALPLLMGAYGVLQPTLAGSLAEARRRSTGVLAGAVIASVVVATASPTTAAIVSTSALIVAFAFIASSIAIFMGALVVTLSIAIAPEVDVDPATYAVGYSLAVILGAGLAITAGFLTVHRPTPHRRRRAMSRAIQATAVALDSIGDASVADQRSQTLAAFRAQQNTMFASRERGWDSEIEASTALSGLNLLGLALALGFAKRSATVDQTLDAIAAGLRDEARFPLDGRAPLRTMVLSDGVDQLLQTEYHRLHAAIWARDNHTR